MSKLTNVFSPKSGRLLLRSAVVDISTGCALHRLKLFKTLQYIYQIKIKIMSIPNS